MRIATIGYEGTTVDALIDTLVASGVRTVADIRALPLSRRPGFSKTGLAQALAERGLDYLHLKALGTPPSGREAARRHRHDEMAAIYRIALDTPEAALAVERLRDLAGQTRVALLCYEREPAHCHRAVLIAERFPDAVVDHLHV